ncbi:MAG: tetratricopeptide repeat protein [Planctomycetota bacterium]
MIRNCCTIAFMLSALSLTTLAPAHDGLHDDIDAVTQRLAREAATLTKEQRASLFLQRAELLRAHGDTAAALHDYARVEQLAPSMHGLWYGRGAAQLAQGQTEAARTSLQHFCKLHPQQARAHLLLATASERLGAFDLAASSLEQAIALQARPQPEHFLRWSRALRHCGALHTVESLRVLEQGLERLHHPVALAIEAVRVEIELQRSNAALGRLARLAAASPRPERWLAWSGKILADTGRQMEAQLHFEAALRAIGQLPPSRRATAATQRLESRIRWLLYEWQGDAVQVDFWDWI